MASRSVLRRVAAAAAGATVTLAAGPLAGVALAAPPVATDGLSPANAATVAAPATVSACYSQPVHATSQITLRDSDALPVAGAKTIGDCGTGTGNKLVFTPGEALTSGAYSVSALAGDATVPLDITQTQWSFTVDATPPTTPHTLTVTNPVGTGTVTVTGKTDANTPVAVSIRNVTGPAATATGSGTSNGTGDFTVSGIDASALADGAIRATAVATDAVGNPSAAGTVDSVKDTAAPVRTATTPADGRTAQSRNTVVVTFNEALKDTSTLSVRNGPGNTVAGTTAFSDGAKTMTFTSASPLTPAGGTYTVTANATDLAGNSAPSTSTFAIDMTAPAAPSVSLTDPVNLANEASVIAWGTAEPGSTVTVAVDDSSIAGPTVTKSGTADSEGAYQVTLDLRDLFDGAVTATATATDPAGNTGPSATSAASTKDTEAPEAPSVTLTDPVRDANKTTAAVSGTAEPGSTVSISIDDATAGSPVVKETGAHATTGAYATTVDLTPLADGAITASAIAIDGAGNPSVAGTGTATKDTGVPGAPSLSVPTVNDANKAAVPVSGVAEPGATVTLTVTDGDAVASDTATAAAGTGAYSKSMDLSSLADGPLSATATAKDGSGNESPARTVNGIAKDTGVPAAPTVALADYVNNAGKAAVGISGTAEPGTAVAVTVSDADAATAHVVANTTAGPNGDWSTTADLTSLADGAVTASATATDAAGNTSAPGSDTAQKDVAAPAGPTVSLTNPINQVNAGSVTVSGGAEPDSAVQVAVDDTDQATGTVGGRALAPGGSYVLPLDVTPLADGALTATATATDAAGNTSAKGTSAASAKDTTALDVVSTSPAHNSTAKPPATVSMTFNEPVNPAQTTISLADATSSALAGATSFTDGNRTIVFTPADKLSDAGSPYTASVSGKDTDGTDSIAAGFVFTVDGTPPGVPSVGLPAVNAANAGAVDVTGVAAPGSSVAVSVDDAEAGSPVTKTVAADGTTGAYTATLDLTGLADGPLSAAAVAADAVGNESAAGTASSTKDATAPAQPSLSLPAYVNDATKGAVTLSGVAEPGSSVTVSVDDAVAGSPVTGTTTAAAGTGAYSTTLDLTGLADGALAATAVATDAAGNPSAARTAAATKDVVAPGTPAVTLADPVNAANKTTAGVSGVTEPGAAVAVSVDDTAVDTAALSKQVTADGDGAYATSFDVTGLEDGTLSATVTATDAAGNASTAGTDSATKDSLIPDVPTLATPAAVTRANRAAVPFSGTAEPGTTVTVTVHDADDATGAVTGSTTAGDGGAWSQQLDLSSLTDGALAIAVTATDGVDNTSAPATAGTTKDVTRAFTTDLVAKPDSGAVHTVLVTAHQTSAAASATDVTYTGTPVLTSSDGHFTAGTCGAAVAGVATCTGVVLGDLGAQTVTAADGTGQDAVTGTKDVVVQATGLEYVTAPPATAEPNVPFTFSFRPTTGVTGASIGGYTAPRRVTVTGGVSTPATGSLLSCAAAVCEATMTFYDRGPKTVAVTDTATGRKTPAAAVAMPYHTVLSLVRSALTVQAGGSVVLSGKLTNTSTLAGVAGQTLAIYRATAPSTTLKGYTTVVTKADGTWSKTVQVSRNTTYQVRYAGTGTHHASVSPQRVVKAAQVVTVGWRPSDRTVTATGTVSPAAAGRTVYLQYRKADGTWAYAGAKATVTSGSGYTLSRTFAAGKYVLRTAVAATSVNSGGYSSTFTLTAP